MKRCVGQSLATLYPFATYLCGGCPVCRQNNDAPYTKKDVRLHLDIESITSPSKISTNLEAAFRNRHIALILCSKEMPEDLLGKLVPLLIANGIEQIVTPDLTHMSNLSSLDAMFADLGEPDLRYKRHRFVAATTLQNGKDELFGLPTAIFYSEIMTRLTTSMDLPRKSSGSIWFVLPDIAHHSAKR